MIRRPPRSTLSSSSAASDVYKRQVKRPAAGILGDQLVELGLMFAHARGELARERVDVPRERLLQRAAEQVALIERPDGSAALLRPTHHTPCGSASLREAHARETYSPERVSTRTTSPMFTNSGTWMRAPVSSTAGL